MRPAGHAYRTVNVVHAGVYACGKLRRVFPDTQAHRVHPVGSKNLKEILLAAVGISPSDTAVSLIIIHFRSVEAPDKIIA